MLESLPLNGLAYLIGGLGIAAEWRAYWLSCGLAFRRWSALAALLWAAQYGLLGAWTAGLTMAMTALRTVLTAGPSSRNSKHAMTGIFVAVFTGLTVLSWQGPVSLLPAFAVINTTLALFYADNQRMRMILLASSAAWLANDLYWQAWPALVAEAVAILINLKTIQRLRLSAAHT